jgi:hypothetical protein
MAPVTQQYSGVLTTGNSNVVGYTGWSVMTSSMRVGTGSRAYSHGRLPGLSNLVNPARTHTTTAEKRLRRADDFINNKYKSSDIGQGSLLQRCKRHTERYSQQNRQSDEKAPFFNHDIALRKRHSVNRC